MPNDTMTTTRIPHICPHQIAFFLDNWIRRLIQNPEKILGSYLREGNTAIDMGCGPGYFTIDMAKMVGPEGRVIAVDIQTKMLNHVRKKAQKHGVAERIECHKAGSGHIGLNLRADFILAFYMIHETPDMQHTLSELKNLLNDNGKMLAVEPRMHVSQADFQNMLEHAQEIGLKVIDLPKRKGGRAVVWSR